MFIMKIVKKLFLQEDSIEQKKYLENMKTEITKLQKEYDELIELQAEIKSSPVILLQKELSKKDKYNEMMENIKYKDINIIKEYENLAMRYNILIDLYKKIKNYIKEIKDNIFVDFCFDNYKQPVALLSQNSDKCNKIILLKNTFFEPDYLEYSIGENIEIINIYSKEEKANHEFEMIKFLLNNIRLLKQNKELKSRIVISQELLNKNNELKNVFINLGFKLNNNEFYKEINA